MSGIAYVAEGADAAKSVEEAVTGAFSCAKDCLGLTLDIKHMSEAEAHSDSEKFTAREVAITKMMEKVRAIAQEKFNIIIVRNELRDILHSTEANPSMGSFRVQTAKDLVDTYRIYIFSEAGSYDRPWLAADKSWEADGIQWYPTDGVNVNKANGLGCMYLKGFSAKPGMTEQERIASQDTQKVKENEQKNHDLDTASALQASDDIRQKEREQAAIAAGGNPQLSGPPSPSGSASPPPSPNSQQESQDTGTSDGGSTGQANENAPEPNDAQPDQTQADDAAQDATPGTDDQNENADPQDDENSEQPAQAAGEPQQETEPQDGNDPDQAQDDSQGQEAALKDPANPNEAEDSQETEPQDDTDDAPAAEGDNQDAEGQEAQPSGDNAAPTDEEAPQNGNADAAQEPTDNPDAEQPGAKDLADEGQKDVNGPGPEQAADAQGTEEGGDQGEGDATVQPTENEGEEQEAPAPDVEPQED